MIHFGNMSIDKSDKFSAVIIELITDCQQLGFKYLLHYKEVIRSLKKHFATNKWKIIQLGNMSMFMYILKYNTYIIWIFRQLNVFILITSTYPMTICRYNTRLKL